MIQRPYEKLLVWQQAHALCLKIYRLTKTFPQDERWRLVDQMSRAAESIPANIVEANGRRSGGDKRRFFNIAVASLEELHYHTMLARDLQYITLEQFAEIDSETRSISYLLGRIRTASFTKYPSNASKSSHASNS